MKCWCTMPSPRAMASCGLRHFISTPSIDMVPAAGLIRPNSTFITVLLPAPFSPTTA